jgi:hypothetical protein
MKCSVQGCKNSANKENRLNGVVFINGKETSIAAYACDHCYAVLTRNSLKGISIERLD